MTRRLAHLLLAGLAVVAVAACGDDGDDTGATGSTGVDAEVTTTVEQADDPLLDEDDVADLDGFAGVEVADVDDLSIFDVADRRGPCGAPQPFPAMQGTVARSFAGESAGLYQVVWDVTEADAAYLDFLESDARPGCEPYEVGSDPERTQRVGDIAIVEVAVPDAVAWTATAEAGTLTSYGGQAFLLAGDRVVLLQVLDGSPVDPAVLAALVERAVAELGG